MVSICELRSVLLAAPPLVLICNIQKGMKKEISGTDILSGFLGKREKKKKRQKKKKKRKKREREREKKKSVCYTKKSRKVVS